MNTNFIKYLTATSIMPLKGKTKREVLTELINAADAVCPVEKEVVEKAVWQREKMMTTGIGQRLALPHIRLSGVSSPIVFIGVSETPVEEYESLDKSPVQIIVFLIAPDNDQENYLKLLGSISAKMKDDKIIEEILEQKGKATKTLKILKRK
jgi:PTS system nitrogen regulatory IIA component